MGDTTAIAWTNKTWNPWQGCHRISPGCANCYMFAEKARYGQDPDTVVRSKPPTFNAPLRWHPRDRSLVFTCSWSDFFIEEADPWRPEAWEIIRATPHLTYQVLTKRPERIAANLPADWGEGWPNVWLGVTIENGKDAARRAAWLLETPAVVRFVSCEPLLDHVDLTNLAIPNAPGVRLDALRGHVKGPDDMLGARVGWVIVGGESGPKARTMEIAWTRSLVEQCRAASVPVFVKQDSGRKAGQWGRLPEDLRVREFPEVVR